MILKIEDKAPFAGVLVWGPKWRNQKTSLDVCLYEEQHPVYRGPSVIEDKPTTVWPWLSGGFILGIIGGLAASHK